MTRALAFVSGVGAPGATMLTTVDCGGSDLAQADGGGDGSSSGGDVGSTSGGGVMTPYDGSQLGVVAMPHDAGLDTKDEVAIGDTGAPNDATKPPPPSDGAAFDVVIYDVATGISIPPDAPYDGRVMGVIIMRDASNDTSFGGGVRPPPDSGGGVQIPPEGGFFDVQGGPTEPPELPA